jgi:hypothetical protein
MSQFPHTRSSLSTAPCRGAYGTVTPQAAFPCTAFVTRLAVHKGADSSRIDRKLQTHRAPSADVQAIPLRLIISANHETPAA